MKLNRLIPAAFSLAAGTMSTVAAETAPQKPNAVADTNRPNILFIMVDQQFADAMSCRMGTQYLNTPAMDSLAKNGQLFTRAYSANPLCMPSRNSIFTGRYPHETGVTKNFKADSTFKIDPIEFPNLGDYFRQAGYRTAYFGKRHLSFSVEDSFSITQPQPPKKNHDCETLAETLAFLSQKPAPPFLLVVSFMNPHNVCELARNQDLPDGPIGPPPAPERCPPVPANLAPQLNEPDTMTIMRRAYQDTPVFPVGNFTPDDWRQLRWGYYRLIEKVDAQIGTLLAALRSAGLADDTLIVFTSDHGESAGAHGWNQKDVFYEESVRVPLIISYPGHTKAGTCDRLVNTGLDLLPTMLDFADVPVPAKLQGRSLRPLALGETVTAWRDHVVVEDSLRQRTEGRMVRSERYKYCVYNYGQQRESLVDLQTDPGETRNLVGNPEYRQILLDHRALLSRFAQEHQDPLAVAMLADDVKPIPFPQPSSGAETKQAAGLKNAENR